MFNSLNLYYDLSEIGKIELSGILNQAADFLVMLYAFCYKGPFLSLHIKKNAHAIICLKITFVGPRQDSLSKKIKDMIM